MHIKRVLILFANADLCLKINWYSTDKIDKVVAGVAYEYDNNSNYPFFALKSHE